MIATFRHPLQKQEVKKILADSYDRSLFFQEYKYFGKDRNDSLYKRFIRESLNSSRDVDLISDVIYLAIEINFFSKQLVTDFTKTSFFRKHYLVKLSCLDYLTHFRDRIGSRQYYSYSETIYKTSRNSLVRAQALTNLVKEDQAYFNKLLAVLKKESAPTAFYRVLRGLGANHIKPEKQYKNQLKELIKKKKFRLGVTRELLSQLQN